VLPAAEVKASVAMLTWVRTPLPMRRPSLVRQQREMPLIATLRVDMPVPHPNQRLPPSNR
jgi:hypothetical protein